MNCKKFGRKNCAVEKVNLLGNNKLSHKLGIGFKDFSQKPVKILQVYAQNGYFFDWKAGRRL